MEKVTALAVPPRSLDVGSLPEDEVADEVQEFVENELKRLKDQIDALEERASKLEDVKVDDPRLMRRIKAEKEALTV